MQSTHFVPDELEQRKGLREAVTLPGHFDFGAEVLGLQERQRLLNEVEDEPREGLRTWRHLLGHLGRRRWVLAVWTAEAVLIVSLIATSGLELWHYCPLEVGPLLACRHCFGGVLAAWELGLAFVWALHLYLSVLLVGAGFTFTPRWPHHFEKNRGVPNSAVQLLLFLSALLLVMMITGCALIFASRSCLGGTDFPHVRAATTRPLRSHLMQNMATVTVVLGTPLLLLGRLAL